MPKPNPRRPNPKKTHVSKRPATELLNGTIEKLQKRAKGDPKSPAHSQLRVARILQRVFLKNPEKPLTDSQIVAGLKALSQALAMGGIIPGGPGSAANKAKRVVISALKEKPKHVELALQLGLIDPTSASRIIVDDAVAKGRLSAKAGEFFGREFGQKGVVVDLSSLKQIIRALESGKFDLQTIRREFIARRELREKGRLSGAIVTALYHKKIYTLAQARHVINLNMLLEAEERGKITRRQRERMEDICYIKF